MEENVSGCFFFWTQCIISDAIYHFYLHTYLSLQKTRCLTLLSSLPIFSLPLFLPLLLCPNKAETFSLLAGWLRDLVTCDLWLSSFVTKATALYQITSANVKRAVILSFFSRRWTRSSDMQTSSHASPRQTTLDWNPIPISLFTIRAKLNFGFPYISNATLVSRELYADRMPVAHSEINSKQNTEAVWKSFRRDSQSH